MTRWQPSTRTLRLVSGLVLFTYLAGHLINHAVGLVSLDAAEAMLRIGVAVWQSVPGTVALYGAAVVHLALALAAIVQRRTWRMPAIEAWRILAGLAVPSLLIGHIAGTRLATELVGQLPQYHMVVRQLLESGRQGWQIALLAPGWIHGCLGLHLAFGRRPLYRRGFLALFGAALLLPVLSAVGFISMSRELAVEMARVHAQAQAQVQAQDQAHAQARAEEKVTPPDEADAEANPSHKQAWTKIFRVQAGVRDGYFLLIAIAVLLPFVRHAYERQRGLQIAIRYPGRTVRVPRGWNVLEASRQNGIAHVSACGGRARCSTCRVQVLDRLAACPAPVGDEVQTLARIGASGDTRLACQLRPTGDISVRPHLTAVSAAAASAAAQGQSAQTFTADSAERELVLLRVQLHDPATTGACLPGDLLYLVRMFAALATQTIERAGGVVDERAGGTLLAVFGLDCDIDTARGQARATFEPLESALDGLAEQRSEALATSFQWRIDCHVGAAVVARRADDEAPLILGAVLEELGQMRSLAGFAESARWVVSIDVLQSARETPRPQALGPLAARVKAAARAGDLMPSESRAH